MRKILTNAMIAIAIIAISTSCQNQIKGDILQANAASATLAPLPQYIQPGQTVEGEGYITECPLSRNSDGFQTGTATYVSVVINQAGYYNSIPTTSEVSSPDQFWTGGGWSDEGYNSSGYYIGYGTFYYTGGIHKMHVSLTNAWDPNSGTYKLVGYSRPY